MKKRKWNLAIVEPNCIACAGLKTIFARTAFKQLVEYANMSQLLQRTQKDKRIDLFLIDIGRDIKPFIEDIDALREWFPQSFIVVMADAAEEDTIAYAMRAGVNGLIIKDMRVEAMIKSLELILLGERFFPSATVEKLPFAEEHLLAGGNGHDDNIRTMTVNISSRETEVLMHLRKGKSNKEIARELDISDATVKVHVKAILRKLRMKNRTEAALWANGAGLLDGMHANMVSPRVGC
jgi:two-component system nitrate/nitrite response regulator NarL